MERRNVKLPTGGTLELEIHDGFYEKIRQHFNAKPNSYVDDDMIRMFVYGATKTALDQAAPE